MSIVWAGETIPFSAGRPSGPGFVPVESLPARASVSAQANQAPAVSQVTYPVGTFEFVDFADARTAAGYGFGAYFQPQVGGIRASGVDRTVFQMRPNSSTRAAEVPAQSTGKTNDLSLIRAGGSGSVQRATILSGFTLLGTPQDHLYNGLLFYYVTGGRVQDVKVKGIPGNASMQPGETFGGNDLHGIGNTWQRFEADGRDATGTPVGASGFGGNQSRQLTILDSSSHHNPYSAGFTCNTCTDITYRNTAATDNGKMGFNFERCGGTVLLDHITALRNGGPHVSIATDSTNATYQIIDPVFDGPKLNVRVTGFAGGARTQDPARISMIVNGQSRPDLMALTLG